MRAVVQRVSRCRVLVDGKVVGEIGAGLLVLLGVGKDDNEAAADYLVDKILGLRVFEDAEGKMNLSVQNLRDGKSGEVLVVSQFTLYGDVRRGLRPSFDDAMRAEDAERVCEAFVQDLRKTVPVETGEFRAHMRVSSLNDGPVTLWLDSRGGEGSS